MQPIKHVDETPSPLSISPDTTIILDNHSASNVSCRVALGDATTGTFYTDMTKNFPVTLLENIQAYFVTYNDDTNTIFTKPSPDFKYNTIIAAFRDMFS